MIIATRPIAAKKTIQDTIAPAQMRMTSRISLRIFILIIRRHRGIRNLSARRPGRGLPGLAHRVHPESGASRSRNQVSQGI